jgi:hypothetical protein
MYGKNNYNNGSYQDRNRDNGGFKKPFYKQEEVKEDPTEKRVKALRTTGGKIILKLIENGWNISKLGQYSTSQVD